MTIATPEILTIASILIPSVYVSDSAAVRCLAPCTQVCGSATAMYCKAMQQQHAATQLGIAALTVDRRRLWVAMISRLLKMIGLFCRI